MVQTIDHSDPPKSPWSCLGAIVAFLLLAPLVVILPLVSVFAAWVAYWTVVPVHSASTKIADLETDLTLRFYYTWDENTDSGRYLSISAPSGRIKVAITAFDWAHNSRTSIYVTPQRKIAVLAPSGSDYLVSLDPPAATTPIGASDDWSYLGAFDFQGGDADGPSLRFVSAAEQAECIPMRLEGPYEDYGVRTKARQRDCSHYDIRPAAK
jgi:hypothetical protein